MDRNACIESIKDNSTRFLRSYLRHHSITAPQQEGYDLFMRKLLRDIVQENSDIWVKSKERKRRDKLWFSGVTILRPRYYSDDGSSYDIDPDEALRKKTTYQCEVRADVHHHIYLYEDEEMETTIIQEEEKIYRNIGLFFVPCMVRSRYCHWHDGADVDPSNLGAYFVICGFEKSMIMLQKLRTNFPVIRKITEDKTEAEIRSASSKWRSTSTIKYYAQTMGGGRLRMFVHIPFITTSSNSSIDVPLVSVFKVLRMEDLEDMVSVIEPESGPRQEMVRRALKQDSHILSQTREEIIESIAMKGASNISKKALKINYVIHIFKSEMLPHIGTDGIQLKEEQLQNVTSEGRWGGRLRAHQRPIAENDVILRECRAKCIFMGFVMNRLLKIHMGELPQDDRDHYINKRIASPGPMLATMLRLNFRGFLRQLPGALEDAANGFQDPITTIKSKASSLTAQFRDPFKKGSWSMVSQNVNSGAVQIVSRINPLATAALGRRVQLTLNKNGKIAAPRQLHLSSHGLICPVETPEGQSTGLMLVLALLARVTLGVPTDEMIEIIKVHFCDTVPLIQPLPEHDTPDETHAIVFVNGCPIGITHNPHLLQERLLMLRRSMDISSEVRIVWYQHDERQSRYFHINAEGSTVMRPLFRADMIVEAANILTDTRIPIPLIWTELLRAKCVEFLDKEEEEARGILIAMRPSQMMRKKRYTHFQIDENNMLGCLASIIPFSSMNQSPR